jgi:hypothetical protein
VGQWSSPVVMMKNPRPRRFRQNVLIGENGTTGKKQTNTNRVISNIFLGELTSYDTLPNNAGFGTLSFESFDFVGGTHTQVGAGFL